MKIKRFIILLTVMAWALAVDAPYGRAVKAWPGLLEGRLENGDIIRYRLIGDEYGHLAVSLEGQPLEVGAYGLRPMGLPDGSSPLSFLRSKREVKRRLNRNFPTKGDLKGLVILAEFADNSFSEGHDASLFHARMNDEGYSGESATGSARDYFVAQSSGLFTPEFDVVGPVKLSNKMYYYGQNEPSGQDMRPGEMIKEACELAKSEFGVDFTRYDFNADDTVDFVYVIYAGYAESYGAPSYTVWPQASELRKMGYDCVIDGKKVDRYACSSELKFTSGETVEGIGTFCHEFGHVLGLPDLYDIYDQSNVQLGVWDIMDQGSYNNDSNTPPSYSAYERASLGWLTLTELDSPAARIELPELTENNFAYVVHTPDPNESFVLENRQQKGWDAFLPSRGMMITHVDFDSYLWESNMVNCGSHSRVDLVEADGKQGFGSFEGDLFPYAGNDLFTDYSYPSSLTWSGNMTGKGITRIMDNDGLVTFSFMLDRLETPTGLRMVATGDDWIDLAWDPVENADSYCLSVTEIPDAGLNPVLFDEDFALCTEGNYPNADFNDISADPDNYTRQYGWTGSDIYQAGGMIQIGRYGVGGMILTPLLDFPVLEDGYTLALRVKSYPGKSVNFFVSIIDPETWEVLEELSEKATKVEKDVCFHLDRIPAGSKVMVSSFNERLFIDCLRVTIGNVSESDIWNLGEREWSVSDIMATEYRLTGILPSRTYRMTVKAVSDSEWHESMQSEEIAVNIPAGMSVPNVDADRKLSSVRIFDMLGKEIGYPCGGLYLVVKTYDDGSQEVIKVMDRD